ncbi:MAG: ABC transporter ATP-binding protein [Gemmatimonadetes bacterium]|nr:ABC transporter ATP-binding protein [Gemmatimonadota bacterium]
MIRIEGLRFRYGEGDFQLQIPVLSVEAGTTTAFIGPSGSGKTTLLNLIAGIIKPETGRVETQDVEVSALPDPERRRFRVTTVGLVFQEFELLEYLSVLDNILLPYRIHSALDLDDSVRDRARSLAERVGISDKLARYPRRLSQGERQRVAVCRAVLTDPPLLLTDEPTGNLDPVNRERVLDILFDYVTESGTTLVSVTHDHEILARFGRVVDFRDFHVWGEGDDTGGGA